MKHPITKTFIMKTQILLIALLLSTSLFAQQEVKNNVAPKKVNNSLGVSLMGKTMQCNGVTASYITTEQARMTFTFGLAYDREYMLGSTPLGIVTGIRLEYCRPYAKIKENGLVLDVEAHDLAGVIPVMLQYHDKLDDHTELLLFTGPSLDMVIFRKGTASMDDLSESSSFLFGSPIENGSEPAWRWLGLSWNYGIGIQYNDICFKLSSSLGMLNHFDKDYTAQYLGYPLFVNRPMIGTVLFKL